MNWKRYKPNSILPWNFDRAKHLLRRTTFGPTWAEIQRAADEGPHRTIDRLLRADCRGDGQRDDFDEISQVIGDAAGSSNDPDRLKAWWLFRMLFTPDPLRERMTLLWHNHFATSNLKVRDLVLMRNQNELFREKAFSKFGDLLSSVLRDPAMLYWLDGNANRQGHPNENLARELMELFTLGAGQFTENDVKEGARALTGWSPKRLEVKFRDEWHDDGEKTILGETKRFDADGFSSLLLEQTATSHRIAFRLCEHFMGEDVVSDSAIDELANGFYEREYDVAWAVETILRSELFFSDCNVGTRISSPVEFVVGTVRSLEMLRPPPSTLVLAEWCKRLDQNLFYPPNVGGWSGGRNWLTSRTVVGRSNFAAALVAGELRTPPDLPQLERFRDKLDSLLLSRPTEESFTERDIHERTAKLLSSPQGFLI